MKFRTLPIILLVIFLTSCSEKFEIVDPTNFNTKIENTEDIITDDQIVQAYFNYYDIETPAMMRIEKQEIKDSKIQLTFTHHGNQKDDSVKSTKITITAKKNDNNWSVLEIKKNWKCNDGRGHTNWGIGDCK